MQRKGLNQITGLIMAVLSLLCLFGSQTVIAQGVIITEDQTVADKFIRHTVTGITTPLPVLPDVPGFVGASYVTVGDIDQNGINEIVCTSGVGSDGNAETFDGAIAIFSWDGADMSTWTQSVINATFAWPNETVLRDMDNDGDIDIMVMDNFIASWFTGGAAGIYWLDNQGGNISDPANWVNRIILQGDTTGAPCSFAGTGTCPEGIASYHRAVFVDIDGDGLEDFVTTKVHMWFWQWTDNQFRWVEWFKKETDLAAHPSGYSGPYEIGDGGGFLFNLVDVDKDGDQDVVAVQFFIQESGGMIPGVDIRGDTLAWFENPGIGVDADLNGTDDVFELWNRYTIENWNTSPNPLGKAFEIIVSDIDNDGIDELVFTNHNHQEYYKENRIWPSGVYYFEIPASPKTTSQWTPISIDTSDPFLDPTDPVAVAADVYAIDRPGGPLTQGSPGMVRADDISGDGYPDLVVPGDGKGAVYYYQSGDKNGTDLTYSRSTLYADPACMPGDAQIVDIDGDGDKEVVVVIYDTGVDKSLTTSSSIFIFEQQPCSDSDSDGACDDDDNCPDIANPNQEDADNDTIGDVCDADTVYGYIAGIVSADISIEIYKSSCGINEPEIVITDEDGYYSLGGLVDGLYIISPIKPEGTDYIINPAFYSNLTVPQAVVQPYNFTSTLP